MKFDFKEWLFLEFDNVMDFLLNPQHRNKTWSELMDEFTATGGEIIGRGSLGEVFSHPKWNYVLKIFKDEHYLRFVRYAVKHPHPSFPRFYGTAQKIIPFYRRNIADATTYIIRIEKLKPVQDKQMLSELIKNYQSALMYMYAVERGEGDKEYEKIEYPSLKERKEGKTQRTVKIKAHKDVLDLIAKYPEAKNLYEAIFLIAKNIEGALDIHSGNIMQRDNGSLVLIDPLWAGENPYQAANRAELANRDMSDFDYPEDLLGGELPKKKRRK